MNMKCISRAHIILEYALCFVYATYRGSNNSVCAWEGLKCVFHVAGCYARHRIFCRCIHAQYKSCGIIRSEIYVNPNRGRSMQPELC